MTLPSVLVHFKWLLITHVVKTNCISLSQAIYKLTIHMQHFLFVLEIEGIIFLTSWLMMKNLTVHVSSGVAVFTV